MLTHKNEKHIHIPLFFLFFYRSFLSLCLGFIHTTRRLQQGVFIILNLLYVSSNSSLFHDVRELVFDSDVDDDNEGETGPDSDDQRLDDQIDREDDHRDDQ